MATIGPETEKLLIEIDAFIAKSGMSERTLGQYAIRDNNVVGRLRGGGGISIERAAALRTYMQDWQPKRTVEVEVEFKPRKRKT